VDNLLPVVPRSGFEIPHGAGELVGFQARTQDSCHDGQPRVAVILVGGGHIRTLPIPMPRALEARRGLRRSDPADADGGRSGCPGRPRRGRQHPSERAVGICASWRCRACGASIRLDRATGAVRLDTSRAETAFPWKADDA
jgi:hypothetical protein